MIIVARETIIGTLGRLRVDAESRPGQQALRPELSPASAVALLIFLRWMQRVATIAARRKPAGSGPATFAYGSCGSHLCPAGHFITVRLLG
jgi:Fe2+ transport system protein B